MTARTLLVVDDDALFADALSDGLALDGLDVLVARTGAEALRTVRERKVDVVLLDQHLPDSTGPELCPAILDANERTKILFMTAFPNLENATVAVRAGAFDYLSKPCELGEVRLSVSRCLKTLDLERAQAIGAWRSRAAAGDTVLVGADGGLAEVARLVAVAAGSDSPVLVTGETGTGKSLVARAIHYASARRERELITVNCAALPETLIEAELFGYEKGAFTGAAGSREGLVEMAEGSTLFLDEIGEMPPTLQTRLLNVLEERRVRRIGGRAERPVDFRPIAATNADVAAALREKKLREDLYYRLNVVRIHLPPLRERPGDVPGLVSFFLGRLAGGGKAPQLAAEEVARLSAYEWPGNLRELRNVLERAILVQRPEALRPSDLLEGGAARVVPLAADGAEPEPLAVVERRHAKAALAHHGGNLTRAARSLGISVSTLRRMLARSK